MKLSEMVEPTQDVIAETKRAYNRILKRQQEAAKYLDDANVPIIERERHALAFRIEILDPMNSYLEVLKDWGVLVTDDEISGGLRIE